MSIRGDLLDDINKRPKIEEVVRNAKSQVTGSAAGEAAMVALLADIAQSLRLLIAAVLETWE